MTRFCRTGMTLVEMLVALAATLLLMAAVAQVFGAFGSAVTNSRSLLEADARMRAVAWKLRSDLAGSTCRMIPPTRHDSGEGYLEIIEGPARESDAVAGAPLGPADHDDVLLLTTRSNEVQFIGRAPTNMSTPTPDDLTDIFESTLAEVGWFTRATPGTASPVTYTLYRRQMLLLGYAGTQPFHSNPGGDNSIPWAEYGSWREYFNAPLDVSSRLEANSFESRLFPNTLTDLSRRETRFMHCVSGNVSATTFPFRFVRHQDISGVPLQLPAALGGLTFDPVAGIDDDRDPAPSTDESGERGPRTGEDVVLTNVLAFDVRVFDPAVPVVPSPSGNTALVPGDPGYTAPANAVGTGAYVDLGHGVTTNPLTVARGVFPHFGGNGDPRSKLDSASESAAGYGNRRTYDTWTTHYEANGKDEDLDSSVDDGTDGLDNDSDGRIDEPPCDANGDGDYADAGDDPGELETAPPYPYPLRGIEVRIRCWEPSSRQVRQVTIRHTFVPH